MIAEMLKTSLILVWKWKSFQEEELLPMIVRVFWKEKKGSASIFSYVSVRFSRSEIVKGKDDDMINLHCLERTWALGFITKHWIHEVH